MEALTGLSNSQGLPEPAPGAAGASPRVSLSTLEKRVHDEVQKHLSVDVEVGDAVLKRQGTRHQVGVETIVEIGAPFNPEARNVELFGIYQRNMPRTVYSAVILDYLCEQSACNGLCVVLRSTFLPLALTATAQVVFASYLGVGVDAAQGDLAADCNGTSFILKCVAMFTFIGLTLGHLCQVFDMHQWLSMFGTSASYENLKLLKTQALNRPPAPEPTASGSPSKSPKKSPSKSSFSLGGLDVPEHHVLHRPASGITRIERTVFYLFLLLPSFAATCFVAWSGSGAVMRASNDVDLVLNSVAAVFVVELDNYAYTLLLPPTIRNKTENLPPLNLALREGRIFFLREFVVRFYSWLLSIVIVGVSVVMHGVWCGW